MASTDPDRNPDIRLWPNPASPALIADPIVQCFILIVVTSAFFLLFPRFDLWFSDQFYISGEGFPVSQLGAFIAFRNLHRGLTWIVPVALILALLVKVALPWRKSLVSPRDALFILSTLAIGPGIVANLIFKNNWGRPRPAMTGYFHGEHPFVGIWQITDYCATNCSFISGEGSSAVWLLTFVVLLPAGQRMTALKVIAVFALLFSLNRVAFGGHYLSDVMLAWWITLAIIIALYRLFYVRPPAILTDGSLDAALGHAGVAIRRLFASRKPS